MEMSSANGSAELRTGVNSGVKTQGVPGAEKSLEDACFASPLGVGPGPASAQRGRPTCGAAYGIHGSVRPRLCLLSAEECYQLFFQFFVQSYDATVSLRVLKVVSKSPWVRGEYIFHTRQTIAR